MIDYGDLPTGMTVKHESGSEVDEIFTRQVEDFDCMDILIVLMCQLRNAYVTIRCHVPLDLGHSI